MRVYQITLSIFSGSSLNTYSWEKNNIAPDKVENQNIILFFFNQNISFWYLIECLCEAISINNYKICFVQKCNLS